VGAVFDNLDRYAEGFVGTVTITLCAFVLAFAIGLLIATFRVSPVPPLRWTGTAWVEVWRNIPLTVILFLAFFGAPKLGVLMEPWPTAVVGCGVYTSAFVAETIRSGFNAVPSGQAEAARALGLTFPQVLSRVVWPQAIRSMVPPMGSVFIALTKNTSIATTIGAIELTTITVELINETAQAIPVFIGTAIAYLVLTLSAGYATSVIERKVAIRR
jgi:glutamate transport system permease protein